MTDNNRALVEFGQRGAVIRDIDQLFRFSEMVKQSGLAPESFRSSQQICVAIQTGLELGLSPMQSLQTIAVVRGRTTVWGDGVSGLIYGSGLCDGIEDSYTGTPYQDDYTAHVRMHRKGVKVPIEATFSVAEAKRAGLWGQKGPWSAYPDDMLYRRALGRAAHRAFPDVLRGLYTSEEAADIPRTRRAVPVEDVQVYAEPHYEAFDEAPHMGAEDADVDEDGVIAGTDEEEDAA